MIELPTESEPVTVVEGDCLELLPELKSLGIAAIVSDPPYGISHDTDYTRFSGGACESRRCHKGIAGDDKPFDPSPWLEFPKVVMFGANCFSDRLPKGSLLVWNKRRESKLGKFMSDCEVAWMKGGHGVYLFNHVWDGFDRASERGPTLHPTQKPVALMQWCIERLRLPTGSLIVDPYAGSGATGVAAAQLGMRCLLIEKEPQYAAICRKRVAKVMDAGLFAETA